jgi:hypothetical protein
VAVSTKDLCVALSLLAAACSAKKRKQDVPRDPRSECAAIFDRYHATLSPLLAGAGITETAAAARARNATGLAKCEGWPAAARSCMFTMPASARAWATCNAEPAFVLYDGSAAHTQLLGAPISNDESDRRIGELTGTWKHPSVGKNDEITWIISPTGKLDVHTISTDTAGKHTTRDQSYQLSFTRERQLALQLGTSVQFVPVFVDGDRLYVSWTSGAIAIRIPNPESFAIDVADRDRWIVWTQPACKVIDPRLGHADATCSWQGDRFIARYELDGAPHDVSWTRQGDTLLHPAMEPFTRQGK